MRLCGASQTALAGTRSRFDGPPRGSLIQWNLPALCCVLGANGACVGSGELIILDMSATTSRTAAEREESLVEDLRYNDFDAFYAACWDDVYRPLAVTLRDSELAREAVDEAIGSCLCSVAAGANVSEPTGLGLSGGTQLGDIPETTDQQRSAGG
jgi:hypothetical protein